MGVGTTFQVCDPAKVPSTYSLTTLLATVTFIDPVTVTSASVYVPLMVGQTVVGDTTVAIAEAKLATLQDEVVMVALYVSLAARVSPVLIQFPLASAVIVYEAAGVLVLFKVTVAFAVAVPLMLVAVESNLLFTSVVMVGGWL